MAQNEDRASHGVIKDSHRRKERMKEATRDGVSIRNQRSSSFLLFSFSLLIEASRENKCEAEKARLYIASEEMGFPFQARKHLLSYFNHSKVLFDLGRKKKISVKIELVRSSPKEA